MQREETTTHEDRDEDLPVKGDGTGTGEGDTILLGHSLRDDKGSLATLDNWREGD